MMSKAEQSAFLEEAQSVFFEAMLHGYAVKAHTASDPTLPGSKQTVFERGPWRVVDTWIVAHGNHSAGWTLIFHQNIPVWNMHYHGYYCDDAIPLLRAALLENYSKKIFLGGRGPREFMLETDKRVRYKNTPTTNQLTKLFGITFDGFKMFEGTETIDVFPDKAEGECPAEEHLGFHKYRGMLLG